MVRRISASILVAAMVIGLGGCVSLLPKAKPAQLYRFGAEGSRALAAADAAQTGGAVEGPSDAQKIGLVLGQIGFPRASTSDGILTVTGDQTAYIAGARWVAPARILFQEAVERAFDSQGKSVQIVNIGDVGAAGGVLRVTVTAFEVRYRRGGSEPTVAIVLSARLTRNDGSVLDQREFSALQPTSADTVSDIVRAFNQGTEHILAEVVTWADQQAPGMKPSPPAPPVSAATVTSGATRSQTAPSPLKAPARD